MSAESSLARSTVISHTQRGDAVPAPRFARVEGDLVLEVPHDCDASVIFRLVAHGNRREYAWWLLVGRSGEETVSVPYRHTGQDAVRCDIPVGTSHSAAALQPHLHAFLKKEGVQEGDTPIIKGK